MYIPLFYEMVSSSRHLWLVNCYFIHEKAWLYDSFTLLLHNFYFFYFGPSIERSMQCDVWSKIKLNVTEYLIITI